METPTNLDWKVTQKQMILKKKKIRGNTSPTAFLTTSLVVGQEARAKVSVEKHWNTNKTLEQKSVEGENHGGKDLGGNANAGKRRSSDKDLSSLSLNCCLSSCRQQSKFKQGMKKLPDRCRGCVSGSHSSTSGQAWCTCNMCHHSLLRPPTAPCNNYITGLDVPILNCCNNILWLVTKLFYNVETFNGSVILEFSKVDVI